MEGTLDEQGRLDPAAAAIIVCVGRKGSGKTIMALHFASTWPYDMVVLDVAGDDGPMPRAKVGPGSGRSHDVFDLRGRVDELPRSWPEHLRYEKRPMILRYVPDPGSPTELEDMDAVAGLAYGHSGNPRPVMLVIHEIGRVAPAGRTPPHMKRILNHSRHQQLTMVACGPRPQTIDPLVIQQADLVYVFELQSHRDRKRVADDIGWDPDIVHDAVQALRQHEHLRYDARMPPPEEEGDDDLRLVHADPLPEEIVERVRRWADAAPLRS